MTLLSIWNPVMDDIIEQLKTITELVDTKVNNGFNATTSTMPIGTLRAVQFTLLPVGKFVDSFTLNINVAAGNVRIKVYDDNANTPNTLLSESNSIDVGKTGDVNFRLNKQVEVPVDGILWVSFENDNATLDIDISSGQSSGTLYTVAHTYGTGPTTFAGTAGTSPFYAEIHYDPKVEKHFGIRGGQEDYFAIVSAGEVSNQSGEQGATTNTLLNTLKFMVDLSYRGLDFGDGLTKNMDVSTKIYDLLNLTTLSGKVRRVVVEIFPQDIEEGQNLFMVISRIVITCEVYVHKT